MNLSDLEKVPDYKFNNWLRDELALNKHQWELLSHEDLLRTSPYYVYKRKPKVQGNVLWRLTIILFGVYWLFLTLFLPFNMIITGRWGYGRNFIDKFHIPWLKKIGLY